MDDEVPWILVLAALAVGAFLWWRSRVPMTPIVGTGGTEPVPPGGLQAGSDTPVIVPAPPKLGPASLRTALGIQGNTTGADPSAKVPGAAPSFSFPTPGTGNNTSRNQSTADFQKAVAAEVDRRKPAGGYQGFGY